ncbi:alpha/beta hydrolase [Peribacillus cavernae]|uniref:Alpha/beta hydrolase n=1 Tax=Peribacillus cavernae TaxID=1674310 RepID=A0A433HAX3_9BACI|nr:alpha/beta hydrolase [Peribacillus cavernae]MDQ0220377.1 proline iminopeptidase [Peribacillus cavernae]RUQ25534.1 alpha/beta hydrolase [Peribacillus cavernae]
MTGEKFISIDGQRLNVNIIGDGEPILFLHGVPGSEHRFFLPHVIPLSQQFKLILYDQRGCGKSEPSKQNHYSMEDEVNTLELLRIELGLQKINLFGESWGSMLALLYATKYPGRVNKILLTASIGVTKEGFERFGQELEKKISEQEKVKLSELEKKLKIDESSLDDILNILDPYYVFSREALKHKEKISINNLVNQSIGRDILNNYDLTAKLDLLSKISILVAQGSHDILTPELIEDLLIKFIPHARLIEIENCGHWTVVERPEEMIRIAHEFFKNADNNIYRCDRAQF